MVAVLQALVGPRTMSLVLLSANDATAALRHDLRVRLERDFLAFKVKQVAAVWGPQFLDNI
jgi:hypothetical protein